MHWGGELWLCLESLGESGKLQSLNIENCMQVKVDNQLCDPFRVGVGLRQGCILSALLFSLYINGMIDDVKQKQCGVASGSTQIPGLLYADDTSLFGEDAKTLQQSLHVLEDWCQEWDMQVNVGKSATIHFRDKSWEQCQDKFVVNGEVIPLVTVSSFKYLECCINDFLWKESGKPSPSMCLNFFGWSFKKLFECMVQSVALYGSQVWGCNTSLMCLDQLQLRILSSFFGVARLHPRVSLFVEMDCLPLCWEARVRCMKFCHKVMTHPDMP